MSYSIRTYSEALEHVSHGDRLSYLQLREIQHQSPRDISNWFYHCKEWLRCREDIITRDKGQDLGITRLYIEGPIIVHHINPLTAEDIEEWNVDKLFNPDNLICCSVETHNIIHYKKNNQNSFIERTPGDTKLW